MVVVRFAFGLATLLILLLYQHHFTESSGILLAGINGIAEVLAAISVGLFLGAVVTPVVVRHIDRTVYIAMLMVLGAATVLTCGPSFSLLGTMIAAPVMAFTYQASKVCADSIVQADSDDAYVGRVFALYDTANNVFYVLAFVLGAMVVALRRPERAAVDHHGVGVPRRRHRLRAGHAGAEVPWHQHDRRHRIDPLGANRASTLATRCHRHGR